MDQKRQPQRSDEEQAQQEQTKADYGEAEIEQLREQAHQQAKEGAAVDTNMKIPDEARTPKERLATAVEGLTPDQPGEDSHGVTRMH